MKTSLFLLLCCAAMQAFAQAYPTRAVRMIVPYPPGGGNDTLARLFAAKLSGPHGPAFGDAVAAEVGR